MKNNRFSLGKFAGSLVGRQKGLTAALILLVVAAAVADLVPPLILGNVVDRLSGKSDVNAITRTLLGAGLFYFLTIFLSRGLEAAREIVLTIWGERLSHGVRKQLADKLSRLPASYFVIHPTGDTVSRFADDVDTLEDLFSSGVISMAADAASLIGIVVVIFTKSPGLAILLLISFPLIGLFTAKIQKKALFAQRANRAAVALANRILPETVAARRPIRLYHGEAFMEERIGALAREIVSEPDRHFVMIAGPSSSGKTTFSHRLSVQLRALGMHPHPFPLDDYYNDHDKMPVDEFGEVDFEALECLDVELFNSDMKRLLKGENVELPTFNFKTGKREYKGRHMMLDQGDILVIEGIHGLNDKLSYSLPKSSKFKIYISALTQLAIDEHNPLSTTDGRLIRRIVRDARTRGTTAKETIAMWDSVHRCEEKNIFPLQDSADAFFNSALIYELAVLKIYAVPELYSVPRDCPEYAEAKRLLKLFDYFLPMAPEDIGNNSLIREFIGGSIFPV